ncbi:MAG: 2-oxoglutarate dehydrogenase E1 component [Alphaproteobacteria bacterium]
MTAIETLSQLTGASAGYVAELYARYLNDPSSVDGEWRSFFAELGDEEQSILVDVVGPGWGRDVSQFIEKAEAEGVEADLVPFAWTEVAEKPATKSSGKSNGKAPAAAAVAGVGVSDADARQATLDSIRAIMLIRAFRVRGHLHANLDPLGITDNTHHPELMPDHYGFKDTDLDRPIFIDNMLGLGETATMRQIHDRLERTYCDSIGVEFMHIQDPDQKAWLQERIEEIENRTDFTDAGKNAILERLTEAEGFENYLHKKYVGTKRFGLDGGEALIPALEQIIKRGSQMGLEEVVIGMAHRGRLNVLTNFMHKPFAQVFSEFQGNPANPEEVQGSGDVKYHLGTSTDREFDGKNVHLSLTANPSHLECVNTVVLGKVRAKQRQREDTDKRSSVMGLLMHGDAAFAGQGLVPEALLLADLQGYRTGGTVHVVINNQIGFTTSPTEGRPGLHATDIALSIQAPIFHVNGDDVEAVVHVARVATEFRMLFGHDVVIDLWCYRRFGHNEGDEPKFTQPLMYDAIAKHKPVRSLYAEKVVADGLVTDQHVKDIQSDFETRMDEAFEAGTNYKPNQADWLGGAWEGLSSADGQDRRGRTAVSEDRLKEIAQSINTVPDDFNLNSKVKRVMKSRLKAVEDGEGIDWGNAESLAFGSLLTEGYPVRLSGQDCGRGTFSHRHAELTDQKDGSRYYPLSNIREDQAFFEVLNSPLSEVGVLGFEYGHSLADPNCLTLWEAQFGDFVNGAQVIIDQFISSGESKWLRMSGLVMLLPHGYEGQGPEHSSARPERFLQSCAEDNMQVLNMTTPANYFHALRRQIHRDFRKPLVIMSPKSLLRHPMAVSPLSMFTGDQSFHRVLHEDDLPGPADKIKRVVLCTGKVYYDLVKARDEAGITDVTFLRLEQLYPFPDRILAEELARFPNDVQVVWCQEEPRNMGYWHFLDRRIEQVLVDMGHGCSRPLYAGRPEAASPATGLLKTHNVEQQKLVNEALTVG